MTLNPAQLKMQRLIRMEVGDHASVDLLTRERKTPMTVVLDHAERGVGPCFDIWWVDGGPPSLACLHDERRAHVVFNTRYLEVSAQARSLYGEKALDVDAQAYRQALRRIAEQLLAVRHPELATSVYLESIRAQRVWSTVGTDWHLLEYEPLQEPYMALWFFGLLHEIGHFAAPRLGGTLVALDADKIRRSIDLSLNRHPWPADIKAQIQALRDDAHAGHVLHPDVLREEMYADIFACSTLLPATMDVLQQADQPFDFWRLAYELLIMGQVRHATDVCAAFVRAIASEDDPQQAALLALAQPIATTVRNMFCQFYLQQAGCAIYEPASGVAEHVSDLLERIVNQVQPLADRIDNATGKAMRRCLALAASPPPAAVPDWFAREWQTAVVKVPLVEAMRSFCRMAGSFGCATDAIHQMEVLIDSQT